MSNKYETDQMLQKTIETIAIKALVIVEEMVKQNTLYELKGEIYDPTTKN